MLIVPIVNRQETAPSQGVIHFSSRRRKRRFSSTHQAHSESIPVKQLPAKIGRPHKTDQGVISLILAQPCRSR